MHTIITRFPNFEVGFLAALLRAFPALRASLELPDDFRWDFIPAGGLEWSQYRGRAPAELETEGNILFNAGGGKFDQHGIEENRQGGGKFCSLDLVLRACPNIVSEKVQPLVARISANDVAGIAISKDQRLRDAMMGLTVKYTSDPMTVLRFLELAFFGAIRRAEAGQVAEDPFSLEELTASVAFAAPESLADFRARFAEALAAIEAEWKTAEYDFAHGRGQNQGPFTKSIMHPSRRAPLRVCAFPSDSIRAQQYARYKKYDVVVIQSKNGHVQIATRHLFQPGGRKGRIDCAPIAAALRRAEAERRQLTQLPDGDVMTVGFWGDGRAIPWYLPEFRGAVFNGTRGNPTVPPTLLTLAEICTIVYGALPECPIFEREEDNAEAA